MDSIRVLKNLTPDLEANGVLNRRFIDNLLEELGHKNFNDETREALVQKIAKDQTLVRLLEKYGKVLESEDFKEAMQSEAVSYGMMKPQVEQGKIEVSSPEELAQLEQTIIKDIKDRIGVAGITNIGITAGAFERFYQENKHAQQAMKFTKPKYPNVWEKLKDFMTSGAITPMILISQDAIQKWRKIIGPTFPEKHQDDPSVQDTIRLKYAKNVDNNIVHGTSGETPEERRKNVEHEINWLLSMINSLAEQAKKHISKADKISVSS